MKEDENGEKENVKGKEIYKKFKDAEIENSKNSFMSHLIENKSKIPTFGLDENGVIKTFYRTPFVQEEIFYICSIDDYGKKQETPYYNWEHPTRLFDDMEGDDYKMFKEKQLNAEIKDNKNKFLNFMSHLVEVEREEDADRCLIIYKDAPTTFDYKIFTHDEKPVKSPDKRIFYLKKKLSKKCRR